MSPELEDATRTALIGNIVLTLKCGDPRRTAAGLIALAQVLIEGDMLGRLAIAEIMREAAHELDQPPKRFARPQVEACSSNVIKFAGW